MTVGDLRETLGALPPDDVRAYLSNNGWAAYDRIGSSRLWAVSEGERDFEVVVPQDRDARDYELRMINLLQVLTEAEGRSRGQILRDLTTVNVDRNHLRTQPPAPSGSISVADGAAAYEGVRELLIAGAYAVLSEPAIRLPRRKLAQVEEFPKKARLGPAEAGSYIISIEVPLEEEDGALFSVAQPLGRRVMLRLYSAIQAAHAASTEALETSELDPFADRVGEGISAQLCRALGRFGGAEQDHPFEMRFAWALRTPTGIATPPVRFDAAMASVLAQAGEDLGATDRVDRDAVVVGTVWRLQRVRPTDDGWIIVRGTNTASEDRQRRLVRVPLPPEDFNQALQASRDGRPVRIIGTLARTGRRTEFTFVRDFSITSTD
ncbi:hypothetical protein [Actinomadura violacea]|uniref:Uncharacterized protein n=1 Tax=Actinomadura violacea TaxID=2819934 RepID=A0ABS3S196_9ACTN|nr:hypothetical protein [Actinomadura violacea]MBO2462681.1 hypothetical protein [Actinomadura violacea]